MTHNHNHLKQEVLLLLRFHLKLDPLSHPLLPLYPAMDPLPLNIGVPPPPLVLYPNMGIPSPLPPFLPPNDGEISNTRVLLYHLTMEHSPLLILVYPLLLQSSILPPNSGPIPPPNIGVSPRPPNI